MRQGRRGEARPDERARVATGEDAVGDHVGREPSVEVRCGPHVRLDLYGGGDASGANPVRSNNSVIQHSY